MKSRRDSRYVSIASSTPAALAPELLRSVTRLLQTADSLLLLGSLEPTSDESWRGRILQASYHFLNIYILLLSPMCLKTCCVY